MTVSNQQTEFPYTGNGVTVTFPYSCQVQKADDLLVYVNEAPITSGITKNGIGSLSGGSVTFSTAPASGAAVRLERVVVLERTTDYQQNGDYLARVVNPDFDRLWMALQQFASSFSRVLRFPITDINPTTVLPPASARANNLLGFDSLGNPVTVAPNAQSASALQALLALPTGSGLIGYGDGTVERFNNRAPSRFGRASAADLPNFMRTLRAYRIDTRPIVPVVGVGSSVGAGATLVYPLQDAPVAWFTSELKRLLDPDNKYNLVPYNYSVNGSTATEFPTAWASALAGLAGAGVTLPGILVSAYGMNDQAPAQYNSGQTYPGFNAALRSMVMTAKKAGWDVVILETPHPSMVLHPEQNLIPPSVAQGYPIIIAAPVGAEAMSPPASQSMVVADYIGEGINISVGYRASRINQTQREVGCDEGAPVIGVERYWYEALQKYQVATGSAGGAEGVLFNPGEFVHPNLVGHQVSYHLAITDFIKSISWQTAQPNYSPRLNGYYGMNLGDNLPTAVFEGQAPYPDSISPPVAYNIRIGVPDANGIKALQRCFEIDGVTGDIKLFGTAFQIKANRALNSTTSDGITQISKPYGGTFTDHKCGEINNSTTWTIKAFPDNSSGKISIHGQNTGVVDSPQMNDYKWFTKAGVLTIAADGTNIGLNVFTVSVSGLSVVVTSINANTNLQARWEATGP